jgi:phosphatidylglycerol lysyltransferase
VIAYVVKGRVALVLGDPIGPVEDFSTAVDEFKSLCALNDWQPAFYQTLPDCLEVYRAAGFETLCIGQEGIVDLSSFTLEGRANKDLRSASNRLTRFGYQSRFFSPPLSDELLEQLRMVSNEWLAHMHGSEKRFSLGWFDEGYIRFSPVRTVESPAGEVVAFANLVPEYRRKEMTIDLMRHRPDIPPGSMDFLFVALFQWAKAHGYETFNLGLSALSGVGESAQDPSIEKALHFIYDHIDQFYNFKGLHEFKEKFHPEWSPRYLVYPGLASLPAVAVAIVRADSGDRLVEYLKR